MKNSTIVHALTWAYRVRIRAEAMIHNDLAATTALGLFLRPRRYQRPAEERDALAQATPHPYVLNGRVNWAWSLGDGPAVFLLHGWEGRGSQLSALAAPLVDRGFRVVIIDAPGHGASPGQTSNAYLISDALFALAKTVPRVHAVVAHSFGGLASAVAFERGFDAARFVVIGTPFSPEEGIGILDRALILPKAVKRRVEDKLAALGERSYESLVDGSLWRAVSVPLLVVHDRADKEVEFASGEKVAHHAPNAFLDATEGLGHRRILKDDDVISRIVAFVDEGSVDKHIWPWDAFLTSSAVV